jgi:hypothetical protein
VNIIKGVFASFRNTTARSPKIEKAQQTAAHQSPRTTHLYDRTTDELALDEIERIAI